MAGLGTTLEILKIRSNMPGLKSADVARGRLRDFSGFGSNPGALLARVHVPDGLMAGSPLVVVLHGCTQTADGYDHGAGWSRLADEMGFALLFPEQHRSNNPNLCFNWFSPPDARRGSGEALSIRQMIAAMVQVHDLDESRIFVTGLSAGGAMASIMLATYPEVFAGGAIIAGLPYGCANTVGDAFSRMRGEGYPSPADLGSIVRDASDHSGPWPAISVWHGSADTVVHPSNADRIVGQWRAVHGLADAATERDLIDGSKHRIWRDAAGRALVVAYEIGGMGHGTPLDTQSAEPCGVSGPFMLEAGISSTRHIAREWGLGAGMEMERKVARTEPHDATPASANLAIRPPELPAELPFPSQPGRHPGGMKEVRYIIEDALRAAGLMR